MDTGILANTGIFVGTVIFVNTDIFVGMVIFVSVGIFGGTCIFRKHMYRIVVACAPRPGINGYQTSWKLFIIYQRSAPGYKRIPEDGNSLYNVRHLTSSAIILLYGSPTTFS